MKQNNDKIHKFCPGCGEDLYKGGIRFNFGWVSTEGCWMQCGICNFKWEINGEVYGAVGVHVSLVEKRKRVAELRKLAEEANEGVFGACNFYDKLQNMRTAIFELCDILEKPSDSILIEGKTGYV